MKVLPGMHLANSSCRGWLVWSGVIKLLMDCRFGRKT